MMIIIVAAVGSTLITTTDFDVMTRASSLGRVITMQLDSKYIVQDLYMSCMHFI